MNASVADDGKVTFFRLPEDSGERRMLGEAASIDRFVLAGDATFTLVSRATGTRFTFRVRACRASDAERARPTLWFVSVLAGASNEDDFAFLGTIFGASRYVPGKRSAIGPEAPSAKAFAWFWARLSGGRGPAPVAEFWHEGRCGRCGRKLTVPDSIASGIGPECAKKAG